MKRLLTRVVTICIIVVLFLLSSCGKKESEIIITSDTGEFPSSFDLRSVDTDGDGVGDRCYVTPVRSQYPFGTCWGFAAMAAAESSILSTVLNDDPDAWKTLNLSEKQLVYYSHTYLDDPSNSQNGEGVHTDKMNSAEDIYAGGTSYLATNTFATGMGPALESRGVAFEYRGKNGKIEQKTADDGTAYDFSYAVDDDWSMDQKDRFLQDYILKEAYLLPSPAKRDGDGYTGTYSSYQYNPAGTRAIKQQLMENRAVMIAFHADTSKPWETGTVGDYMDATTWAHYTWKPETENHAVTIVGWDDNYDVSNFPKKHQPPANGAWLVKNSWGSGTNDFPDAGKQTWGIPVETTDKDGNAVTVGSGYFWLSYYDQSISTPEAFVFDVSWNSPDLKEGFLDAVHREQYDYLPAATMPTQKTGSEVKAANIFTAAQDESVIFISYEFAEPDTTIQWQVYLLAPDYTSPEDGVLMAEGENTYQYGGFYMENILPYLTLQKGQSYSIVLTQKTSDGQYAVSMPMGTGKDSTLYTMSDSQVVQYAVSVLNKGESFLRVDGTWIDYSTKDALVALYGNEQTVENIKVMDPQFDNFPLKGFAIDKMFDWNVQLSGGETQLTLHVGDDPKQLLAEVVGSSTNGMEQSDFYYTWGIPKSGEGLITLTTEEGSPEAAIAGVKPGKTWLFLTGSGAGTQIISVVVE